MVNFDDIRDPGQEIVIHLIGMTEDHPMIRGILLLRQVLAPLLRAWTIKRRNADVVFGASAPENGLVDGRAILWDDWNVLGQIHPQSPN